MAISYVRECWFIGQPWISIHHAVGLPIYMGISVSELLFCGLVYAVAREGLFTRFLESGVLRYLGRISYGLYVYHNGAIWFANRIRDIGVDGDLAKPLSTLLAFAASLFLAALTYRVIEKPFLVLKDRYFPVETREGA